MPYHGNPTDRYVEELNAKAIYENAKEAERDSVCSYCDEEFNPWYTIANLLIETMGERFCSAACLEMWLDKMQEEE